MGAATVQRTDPGAPHTLDYGGESFKLPPTMPVGALDATINDDLVGFFKAIMKAEGGDEQWERFANLLNPIDLPELGVAVGDIYGPTLGESKASGSSSPSDTPN